MPKKSYTKGIKKEEILMNQEKIGKLITTLRKEKKLTQKELANILGVSDKSYQNGKEEFVYLMFLYLNHYVKFWVLR